MVSVKFSAFLTPYLFVSVSHNKKNKSKIHLVPGKIDTTVPDLYFRFSPKGQDCSEVPLCSVKDRGGTYHLQEGCVFIRLTRVTTGLSSVLNIQIFFFMSLLCLIFPTQTTDAEKKQDPNTAYLLKCLENLSQLLNN